MYFNVCYSVVGDRGLWFDFAAELYRRQRVLPGLEDFIVIAYVLTLASRSTMKVEYHEQISVSLDLKTIDR